MKRKHLNQVVIALSVSLLALFACQKKNPSLTQQAAGTEENYGSRSTTTGGSTTGTEPPLLGNVLGSSNTDYTNPPYTAARHVFKLYAGDFSYLTPLIKTFNTGEGYYGVGSYGSDVCFLTKTVGNSQVLFTYNNWFPSYSGLLTMGSAGSDFLPNEIEMSGAGTGSVYALSGNSLYRIDNITAGSPYANTTAVINFPSGWSSYAKTICRTDVQGELRLFVAPTAAPRGSTSSVIYVYKLTNLIPGSGTTTYEGSFAFSYNNNDNLSSYFWGLSTNWYHLVVANSSANTCVTTMLSGTLTPTAVATTTTSFPAFVNDCARQY